ncbi:hypothetical protein CEP53_015045 [Fusarium sp. AF-6]|nr:hypothetical protein CEP53_015045 [Fusarium sp. AF-6]
MPLLLLLGYVLETDINMSALPTLGFAKAGEQTATALEANLSNLESKLDAILAALEARADPQTSTSATAAEAEGPVESGAQADGHAEAKEGADKHKHKQKEDAA